MPGTSRTPVSTRALLALAVACAFAGTALAHHGWTQYDETKRLTLTGKIRVVQWENPHGMLDLDVTGEDANAKVWHVVLAPPWRMEAPGFERGPMKLRGAMKLQDVATVVGHPHKTKPDEMRAERITVAGQTFELR